MIGEIESNPSGMTPAFVFDDAEDRKLAEAERAVIGAGYRLAVQCLDCKSWLVSAKSVAAHRGPVCRGRRGGPE